MADIFVSYASPDRGKAKLLAERLMQEGYSVWWDRTIPPGRVFDEVIQEALDAAKCVIVLWSGNSVRSNWVKTEAAEAAAHNRLVPAFIEPVEPPIEFKRIQAADLSGWDGERDHPELSSLLASVRRLLLQPATPEASHYEKPVIDVPHPRRRSWLAPASIAVAAVAVGLGALLYRNAFQASSITEPPPYREPGGESTPTRSTQAEAPPPANPPAATNKQSGTNLLAGENGGELLIAAHQNWLSTIDGKEDTYAWVENGEAVFGFKDGKPATFDTFTVLIPSQYDYNLREFELLAGSDSPTGRFESIGKFTTQNLRVMKQPYQEFRFAPVTAKYLKVRSLKNQAGSSSAVIAHEFQLLGRLE